jgi:hypothetical protein
LGGPFCPLGGFLRLLLRREITLKARFFSLGTKRQRSVYILGILELRRDQGVSRLQTYYCICTFTRTASQTKNTLLAEGRTFSLENFKYGLESWRHTPATAWFPRA